MENLQLRTNAAPKPAVEKVAEQMREAGIPVRSSNIVLFALGKTIGLTGRELTDFAIPRHGRLPGNREMFNEGDS